MTNLIVTWLTQSFRKSKLHLSNTKCHLLTAAMLNQHFIIYGNFNTESILINYLLLIQNTKHAVYMKHHGIDNLLATW